jgi:hypothetical protein
MVATTADRVAKHVFERSKVQRAKCSNPKRRAKLEADNQAWLKHYCAAAFFLPFEKPHIEIINGIQRAHETGGRYAVAAERGIGKSSIFYGMTLKYVLSGAELFPVYIPWGANDKSQGFDFWVDCLCNNDRIYADYPEFCGPFRHAQGVSQRISSTVWEDTGLATHAKLELTKGRIIMPDGRGYIGSSTVNGNPRGLNATQPGGKIIRPTMVMIDDVQDDEVAASQGERGQVGKIIRKINGAVYGLKRAGTRCAILMSGNCITHGDVMDHYLNHAMWDSVRVACVEQWPKGWSDPKSRCRQYWDEFADKVAEGKGSRTYYRKHKRTMTQGMVLSAPKAYVQGMTEKAADKRLKIKPPIDAYHAVMMEYVNMGHDSFMAERQQQPVDPIENAGPYTLTKDVILSRTTKRKAYEMPDWVTHVQISTDVNPAYALSTAILGFGADRTCAVAWYGRHRMHIPGNVTREEFDAQLYKHLEEHGKELAAMPIKPDDWAIDCGGQQFDAVIRYAQESTRLCGIPASGYQGRGKYRPGGKTMIGVPREGSHQCLDRKKGRRIKWVAWDSNAWRERAQRSWLGDIASPGACSLPAGNHSEFADQITAERLISKVDAGLDMVAYTWYTEAGAHDFGDVMAQGFAAAAFNGIGTRSGKARRKGKLKIPTYRPKQRR